MTKAAFFDISLIAAGFIGLAYLANIYANLKPKKIPVKVRRNQKR